MNPSNEGKWRMVEGHWSMSRTRYKWTPGEGIVFLRIFVTLREFLVGRKAVRRLHHWSNLHVANLREDN